MFTVKGTQTLLVTLVGLVAQFWAQNCDFNTTSFKRSLAFTLQMLAEGIEE